jgi:hypothetical protein
MKNGGEKPARNDPALAENRQECWGSTRSTEQMSCESAGSTQAFLREFQFDQRAKNVPAVVGKCWSRSCFQRAPRLSPLGQNGSGDSQPRRVAGIFVWARSACESGTSSRRRATQPARFGGQAWNRQFHRLWKREAVRLGSDQFSAPQLSPAKGPAAAKKRAETERQRGRFGRGIKAASVGKVDRYLGAVRGIKDHLSHLIQVILPRPDFESR